jgi:hypothetical protein
MTALRLPAIVTAAVAVLAVAATSAQAQEEGPASPVSHFAQPTTLGFYKGKTIEYLDFGPVKLRAGNKLAPIWAFTNGAAGQVNVVDTVPGQRSYTPLWSVRLVTWKNGVTPRVLTSRKAVDRAVAAGQATVRSMPIVVNCPVL